MNSLLTIDWQAFHFIRPEWLWAMVPLILLAAGLRKLYASHSGWQQVLPNHLHTVLLTAKSKVKQQRKPPTILLAVTWILTCIAMAGPTWERLPQPVYNLKQGSVILLDMSLSMRATDIAPDRVTRARFKAIDLVSQLSDGEVGMVAYAGDAFVISPLTEDANNLTALIPSVSPEIMPIPGSEPIMGFEIAAELLANAGYQQGQIFWFTDGIERQQFAELADFAASSPYVIQALAIGSEDGAPIQQVNGELLKDSRGAIVVPRLTPRDIRAISVRSGGSYALMSADDSDIKKLLESGLSSLPENLQEDEQSESTGDKWQDMGAFIVVLLLPFAAYAFRRGLIMLVPLLMVVGLTPSQVSYAQQSTPAQSEANTSSSQPSLIELSFNTADQLGQKRYDAQHFTAAAEQFDDPMWRGASHYRAQNYEEALQAFSEVNTLEAQYNQGNTLAHLGRLDEAIAAYEAVLEQSPEHIQAAENKALLEQLKEQQEQQNQDSQNSDSQENSDQTEQNQQSQSDSANDSESSEQTDSSQQNAESQQQDNQSNDQQSTENAEMRENEQPESQQDGQQQNEPQQSEQQNEQQQPTSQEESEQQDSTSQQTMQTQETEEPLTEEQREQMQRMQNLMRKIPDDPAFLLQRKMQLESQQRKRDRVPPRQQKNW